MTIRSWSSSAVALSALAVAGSVSAGSADEKITVMNPAIAGKVAPRAPLTARFDSVEGKTLYLIDIQWGGPEGGYQLLEEMQAWFNEKMPGVKTVLRRTKDNMFGDDVALWKEIDERGGAAILGTGQ